MANIETSNASIMIRNFKMKEAFYTKLGPLEAALARVQDNSVIAISGFNLAATPEHLILGLFERYQKTGHPRSLFLICDSLPAVPGRALDLVSEQIYKQKDYDFLRGFLLELLNILQEKESPVLVNLGVGIPAVISTIAAEEQLAESIVTVLESGLWGGMPFLETISVLP